MEHHKRLTVPSELPACLWEPDEAVTVLLDWSSQEMVEAVVLTGVELEEKLDSVVIKVTAVQDDLDEWGEAALPSCGHRDRARHVQGVEHCGGRWGEDPQ